MLEQKLAVACPELHRSHWLEQLQVLKGRRGIVRAVRRGRRPVRRRQLTPLGPYQDPELEGPFRRQFQVSEQQPLG